MLFGIILIPSGDGYFYYVPMRGEHIGTAFFLWGLTAGIFKYVFHKKNQSLGKTIVICESCSKKYELKHLVIMRCSLCNGKLIDIDKSPDKKALEKDTR